MTRRAFSLPTTVFKRFFTVCLTLITLQISPMSMASTIEVAPENFTTGNSAQWLAPDYVYTDRPFNVDINLVIDGHHYELQTQGVIMNDALSKVIGLHNTGELRLTKTNDNHNAALIIKANASGELRYQYWVNERLVDNQVAAQQFMTGVLNQTLANKQHFKQQVKQSITAALRNTSGHTIKQDKAINQMLSQVPTFEPIDKLRVAGTLAANIDIPFIFWGLIISGPNVASIDRNGLVIIKTTRSDGVVLRTLHNLDDRKALQTFLNSSKQRYIAGETEKAMIEKLLLERFIQLKPNFSWILNKA
jgi:hypothetical protein